MQPKQVYHVGFLTTDMFGMKIDQKVDILEEKEKTYIIRMYQNSPALEIEKSMIRSRK